MLLVTKLSFRPISLFLLALLFLSRPTVLDVTGTVPVVSSTFPWAPYWWIKHTTEKHPPVYPQILLQSEVSLNWTFSGQSCNRMLAKLYLWLPEHSVLKIIAVFPSIWFFWVEDILLLLLSSIQFVCLYTRVKRRYTLYVESRYCIWCLSISHHHNISEFFFLNA